jgi:hypothetical protein
MADMGGYEERLNHAVYAVLIELGQVLGSYIDSFVVVGGSVPWLLYRHAEPKHIGTIDVDLSLDHEALGDGEYANLVRLLEAAGYRRGVDDMRAFQMFLEVHVDDGDPVKVIVDFLMPRRARFKKNRPPLLAGFAVQRATGADVANMHFVQHELSGSMPDGRRNSVRLRVASIPAFLVMKGYAIVGRDKPKDSYDVYYAIKHFEGGVEALGETCVPLIGNPVAREAYQNIALKFAELDGYGPQTVAKFLIESNAAEGMSPAQIAQDAFGQIQAWIACVGFNKK